MSSFEDQRKTVAAVPPIKTAVAQVAKFKAPLPISKLSKPNQLAGSAPSTVGREFEAQVSVVHPVPKSIYPAAFQSSK
jgi:hypothetical protein